MASPRSVSITAPVPRLIHLQIKHVDEDTGQIRDNVWEFQHPSFQAGGKTDLDSIKRKAVAPRKGQEAENETSPAPVRVIGGLTMEDAGRMVEMESRVLSLEDSLARAIEEVREARNRELGLLSVVKELIAQVAHAQSEPICRTVDAPADQ